MSQNSEHSDSTIQNHGLGCEISEAKQKRAAPLSTHLPHHLVNAIRNVYEPAGVTVTKAAQRESESFDYGACRLSLSGHVVAFRVAKTTPKKIGQFVTLWKRPQPSDAIAPFDISDGIAFIVVSAFDALHSGQFVFSQKVLVEKGIMSRHGAGGKRAIRVYPPWTKPLVQMARKTQKWQLQYFFPIQQDGIADSAVVRKLFDV